MPKPLDANTPAGSSPADAATGASATPTGDDKTLAQIVQEAAAKHMPAEESNRRPLVPSTKEEEIQPKEEVAEEEPTPPAEGEAQEPEGEVPAEETEVEPSDDPKDKDLPFHKHPRFQELLKERNADREKLKALEPFAQQAQNLTSYCDQHNISQEDFEAGMALMALRNSDPAAFRTQIQEMVDVMDYSTGARLPEDLQKQVDAGAMPLEAAKELAQWRAKHKINGEMGQRQQKATARQTMEALTQTLNTWEQSQMRSDPDYSTRREALSNRIEVLMRQQLPRTPQDMVRIAEQANKDVKSWYSKAIPQRRPTVKKSPSSARSSIKPGEGPKLDNLKTDLPAIVDMVMARHR